MYAGSNLLEVDEFSSEANIKNVSFYLVEDRVYNRLLIITN